MSASVRFVCKLIAEPELLRSRDGKPFAGYGVAIGRRIEIEAPEWVGGELTGRSVTTDTAVNHFDHSTERVVANRRLRQAALRGGETGRQRIEHVLSLSNRLGEVVVSRTYDRARLERQTALAVTTGS